MKKTAVIFLLLPALSGYAQDQTYDNTKESLHYRLKVYEVSHPRSVTMVLR